MKTQSRDTDIRAEKVLIQMARKASVSQKMSQVRSLSKTVMQLSRRAIARANKGASEREIDILFVKYHYGDNLADRFRHYLESHGKI